MKKEELVQLHTLLACLKQYCEENCLECDFKKYNELEISPYQVHRSKKEHNQAIFLLATALAVGARTILEKRKRRTSLRIGILESGISWGG